LIRTATVPEGDFLFEGKKISRDKFPEELKLAVLISSLCSNATIQKDPETQQWEGIGDPTGSLIYCL
jgi:hypothetical protein